jgi:transcription termination/antitermination protein NusG
MPEPRWYGLHVRARQEKAARDDLLGRGIEVFLPLSCERRAWSDRIRSVETALFPGYLFVRVALDAACRVELLRPRGVVDLVGRLPGDERIARAALDSEIESLRTVLDAERAVDPVERLVPGMAVVVGAGPLRGARGVVDVGVDGRRRLVVFLELLGRGVRTVLRAEDVVEDFSLVRFRGVG